MTHRRTGRKEWTGSLCLAFAAAVTLPATVLVLGPALGRSDAIALHWVFAAAAWAIGLAPTVRRALAAAAFVLIAGAGLIGAIGAGPGSPGPAWVLGIAVLVGLTRSVILFRATPIRGLVAELAIGIGAALLAAVFAGSSMLASMAAIWGFWLAQSIHALLPGLRAPGPADGAVDAFERAISRLQGLLEDA
jgi:hypothetical protein